MADDEPLLDPSVEARAGLGPDDRVCGRCLVWKPTYRDDQGRWVGPCRLMPHRGDFPATAPICERFMPLGSKVSAAPPAAEPSRRRARTLSTGPVVRRAGAAAPVPVRAPRPDVDLGDLTDMTRNELVEVIREALDEGPLPPLANKWEGGKVVLEPGNGTQAKELPLDMLLKKIVRVRDQLRVLEAKLNAHDKLTDAEKVDLQVYLTRCYGALTTFNVLFKDEGDKFHGSGG